MNIRLRDINVRPLSQLWLMVLLFIHALTVDAETFQSATLKRDDDSLIHYYLSPSSDTSAADTLLLLLQGSDCRSVVQDLDGLSKKEIQSGRIYSPALISSRKLKYDMVFSVL